MLNEFAKYWKQNFLFGFERAWKSMGFVGKAMDVIIAMTVGKIYGQDNAILIGIITIVTIFAIYGLYGVIFTLFIVPFQENKKQQEIIDSYPPEKLNIFVGPSPMVGWQIEDNVDIRTTYLRVISMEKKKIIEFHATKLELLQRTGEMKQDNRGIRFGYALDNFRFEWSSGNVFIELIPGDKTELLISKLDPKIGYPVFGEPMSCASDGKRPSIYEVYIQFKGKREGETDFAYYNYRTELFCYPEHNILDFAADAPDIPNDLKLKVFFAKKDKGELYG